MRVFKYIGSLLLFIISCLGIYYSKEFLVDHELNFIENMFWIIILISSCPILILSYVESTSLTHVIYDLIDDSFHKLSISMLWTNTIKNFTNFILFIVSSFGFLHTLSYIKEIPLLGVLTVLFAVHIIHNVTFLIMRIKKVIPYPRFD